MNFSWKALVLAPLPVPALVSICLELSAPGKSPLAGFLLLFALSSMLCYGTVLFAFLPCLFVLSRFTQLKKGISGAVGALLGCIVYGPVMWVSYQASGNDSGPPDESFLEYLGHHGFGLDFWGFIVAGFLTAMLYWFLAKASPRKASQCSV